MYNASPKKSRSHERERGVTLIELIIVIVIVTMMSLMLDYAVRSTRSADQQLETLGRASLHGQRLTNEIANLASASRHIYDGDDVGTGYLKACDLSRFPPASDARLTIIDEVNDLDVDEPDESRTGNTLLILKETAGSPCVGDEDTGKIWLIDTYRLTAIYPHVTERRIMHDGEPARDVVVWQSEAFPSLQQINEIPDKDERKSVITDLVERYGFDHAWDPRLDVTLAFYALEKDKIDKDPAESFVIREDPFVTQGPRLGLANVQLAASDASRYARRAVLTANEMSGWQPHGLELKVTGSSKARKVWIHTVVEAGWQGGRKRSVQGCTTIADARDY